MNWRSGCIRRQEPLSNRTSFRIGGPAEWFAEPSTTDELIGLLREAKHMGMPVSVIGGGTNTLAADRGFGGIGIHLGKGFRTVNVNEENQGRSVLVRCGAALLTQRLVSLASYQGWERAHSFAGLPGQLGGAVIMNAQGIGRFVRSLQLVRFDGTVKEMTRDKLCFSYR